MKRALAPIAAAICVGALGAPLCANAHHSFFGRFDTGTVTEIEGEVTELLWRNPHAYLRVHAVDANGAAIDWDVETSSLTVLKRMGIDVGTIHVGDRVRIAGNPPLSDKKEMYARHLLLPDGRELLLNVGLKPRWSQRALGDESLLMARTGDGSRPDLGLFRSGSHTRAEARLFREATDPNFDIQSYPMTPAARAALAKFDRATDNPTANCVPKGMPTIMEAPYPIEFVRGDYGDICCVWRNTTWSGGSTWAAARSRHRRRPRSGSPSATGKTALSLSGPGESTGPISASSGFRRRRRSRLSSASHRLQTAAVTDPATFTEPVVLEQYWLWLPSVQLLPYECTQR